MFFIDLIPLPRCCGMWHEVYPTQMAWCSSTCRFTKLCISMAQGQLDASAAVEEFEDILKESGD